MSNNNDKKYFDLIIVTAIIAIGLFFILSTGWVYALIVTGSLFTIYNFFKK
jgi:hypothetical protein